MPGATPTTAEDRIELLDALRGFALIGILLMNIGDLSLWDWRPAGERQLLFTARFDGAIEQALEVVFHAKFYTVFSLLFGIGFSLQLAKGAGAGPRLARRLGWLFAIGMAHMALLWGGDILAAYALVGLALIPLQRLSSRALLIAAAALLLLPIAIQWLFLLTGGAADPGAGLRRAGNWIAFDLWGYSKDPEQGWRILSGDDWRQLVDFNLLGPFYRFGNLLSESRLLKILAVFLIGVCVGRSGMLRDLAAHRRLLRRVLVVGLLVGAPASLGFESLADDGTFRADREGIAEAALYALGAVPLGLAYAAGFALLFLRPGWRRVLGLLAPAGRMALTCYLGHTALAIALFYGIGLGWSGRLPPSFWLPFAVGVVALQAAAAAAWLRRYRYGPVEWIWRQLTYRRRLPLRRAAPATL